MTNDQAKSSILIVDDSAVNLSLLCNILDDENYNIRCASNGEQAIRSAITATPDLVLLDIMMPEIDGFEVCRRLKALKATNNVPIIFLSALETVETKVQCFEAGAVDYVTKPFEAMELLSRVNTHIRMSRLQIEIEASNEQLSYNLNLLEKTQQQLVESRKLEALSLMSVALSHELNTPLGNCLTTASSLESETERFQQLLALGKVSKRQIEQHLEMSLSSCSLLQTNIRRAAVSLKKLRDASTFEITQQPAEFELGELVELNCNLFCKDLKSKNIEINWLTPLPANIFSNIEAWNLIIFNLIDNSLQHGFAKRQTGQIKLSLSQLEDGFKFEYSDNGSGMSDYTARSFFDPFATSELGQGNLGLGGTTLYNAVTHQIGGQISLVSEPNNGCHITINVPIQ